MWEKSDSCKLHTQGVKKHFSHVRQYENQHPIKSKQVFVRIYENWVQSVSIMKATGV